MRKSVLGFFLFLPLLLILSVNTIYAEDETNASVPLEFNTSESVDLAVELAGPIEINSCQVLNQTGATYVLNGDILNIDAEICLYILGNNIVLDCNENSIKPISVYTTIRISGNNTLIKNCNIESLSAKQGYKNLYVNEGIYIDHAYNVTIKNNRITNFYYGIMAEGEAIL
jgi:hypothetical protein